MKNLFCLVLFCLCFSLFSVEYKYKRPVKALITVTEKSNSFHISGVFEREKRYSKAFNKNQERKYVRLFAENALLRYLKKDNIKSVSFQASQIQSNIATAKEDENISFLYVIPVEKCKFVQAEKIDAVPAAPVAVVPVEPVIPAVSAPAPVAVAPVAVAPVEPVIPAASAVAPVEPAEKTVAEKSDAPENNVDDNIVFEIASPEEIFDKSLQLPTVVEKNHNDAFNKILSDFERKAR